jgi:ligand-binding sensor protein
MAACQASWRSIAELDEEGAAIHVCHAGIQYASAPVSVGQQRLGLVTAGQFYTEAPDPEAFRLRALATGDRLGIDGQALGEAMDTINVISHDQAIQITNLLQTIANAISSIGFQSYQARQTLDQIAKLTAQANGQPTVNTRQ